MTLVWSFLSICIKKQTVFYAAYDLQNFLLIKKLQLQHSQMAHKMPHILRLLLQVINKKIEDYKW